MEPGASSLARDTLAEARRVLRETFGYREFRPGQAELIAAVLEGKDALGVMPTGGGKSLCYQVPALLAREGVTVVVSPLVALMEDQVAALREHGVPAVALHSARERGEQLGLLTNVRAGAVRLLYVAPERFADPQFVAAAREAGVRLLAVDEAHCVSQWGHDFRPSYRDIGAGRVRLGNPPLLALTATADARVREDIVRELRLRDPAVCVAGFDRPDLFLASVRCRNRKERAEFVAERLAELREGAAIVYCGTRRAVEELSEFLRRRRIACVAYHAGMDHEARARAQELFVRDRVPVIVATNAFGMGIDKPDVRLVIHTYLPTSLEAYYQEAGRAGRDGEPAACILAWTPRDRELPLFFIEREHPEPERVASIFAAIASAEERVLVRDLVDGEEAGGVNAAIRALELSGLVERWGGWVSPVRGAELGQLDLRALEEHRAYALAKWEAMERYARTETCLRAEILRYFGERAADRCDGCSNCVPTAAEAAGTERTEEQLALFEQLRRLRREIAEREGVPAYVVFGDATLREMAARKPGTKAELLQVAGVGRTKLERYGEAFLALLRAAAGRRKGGGRAPRRLPPPSVPVSAAARRTWQYLREGASVAEAARRRGLSERVVREHLLELVEAGYIRDPGPWVDPALVERALAACGGRPPRSLAELREALGGGVSLEELRLVRAFVNRELRG